MITSNFVCVCVFVFLTFLNSVYSHMAPNGIEMGLKVILDAMRFILAQYVSVATGIAFLTVACDTPQSVHGVCGSLYSLQSYFSFTARYGRGAWPLENLCHLPALQQDDPVLHNLV